MNLKYLIPRLARHFLPEKFVRFLLLRGWIIRPGIETSSPAEAAERYRLFGISRYPPCIWGDIISKKRSNLLYEYDEFKIATQYPDSLGYS